jgi:uncharacterized protein involved in exopolysaccharide biosynthesis
MSTEASDLRRVLDACRRHILLVVAAGVVGAGAAAGAAAALPPRYDATATLFVSAATDARQPALGLQQAALAQTVVPSYAQLAQTRFVAAAAAARLGLPPSAVIGHVRADSEAGLQVLRLHGEATSSTLAARIANAAAHVLSERVDTIVTGARAVEIDVVDAAVPPSAPTSPKLGFSLLLGALVGLGVGAALALACERQAARRRARRRRRTERFLAFAAGARSQLLEQRAAADLERPDGLNALGH